jgi:hypothetical protein
VRLVHATKGKYVRAEPAAAIYEQGRAHHVGLFPKLEDQMCGFLPDMERKLESPDRADALVWAASDLMLGKHMWSPAEMEAWARGDDLVGPQWGDAPAIALSEQTPGVIVESEGERYLREVKEMDIARIRALRGL